MSSSNTDALLIESLNNMYNQNIRVIDNLNYQNHEIHNTLIQLSNRHRANYNHNHRNREDYRPSREDYRREDYRREDNRREDYRPSREDNRREDYRPSRQGYRPNTNIDVRRPLVNRNNGAQHTTRVITPVSNRPRMDTSSGIDTHASYIIREFFTPVNVYPTQEQINTASRNVRYGDIVRPTNTTCPITLETFSDNSEVTVIRHCGHVFNTDDFNSWFRINCRCPVCRYDIREYTTGPDASVAREEVEQDSTTEYMTDNMIETALDQVFSQTPTRFQYSIYRLFDSSNNAIY
jgi:hypothetical protein